MTQLHPLGKKGITKKGSKIGKKELSPLKFKQSLSKNLIPEACTYIRQMVWVIVKSCLKTGNSVQAVWMGIRAYNIHKNCSATF